ncbi:alpha beta-hydrolase [Meredithblackwellia eburnea MCA 4105]
MSCDDCFTGKIHTGTEIGSFETLAGIKTYVSIPPEGTEYDKETAILYLGDIYGHYSNAKLLCDSFALAGFATYYPDYFHGEPVPEEAINEGAAAFDRDAWRTRHPPEKVRTAIDPLIDYLKSKGVKKFGATGYCFGGRYVVYLAIDNLIQAGVAAHPGGITFPQDFEKVKEVSKTPLLFNACEFDKTWPRENQTKAETLMQSYVPGWKQNYYPGCTHGFATRADLDVPEQKFGKENAFEETVAWFRQHLK